MIVSRGQTSIEVLLVVSFVILVVLAVVIPYVESQNITNAAYVAKLSVLPFVEKNTLTVKINRITPEVDPDAPGHIILHIQTSGAWDGVVGDELNLGINGIPSGCQQVCLAVLCAGGYSSVEIVWPHACDPNPVSCVPPLPTNFCP